MKAKPIEFQPAAPAAFTLLEVLVGMAVFSILMVAMIEVLSTTQKTWLRTKAVTGQYRSAHQALETMSRRLAQASLNSYWDYRRASTTAPPYAYGRNSELHYVSGPVSTLLPDAGMANGHGVFFIAPFGVTQSDIQGQAGNEAELLNDLLNGWGYYVEFGSDESHRPPFLAADTLRNPLRWRFRLMEYRLPAESLDIFTPTLMPSSSIAVPKIQTLTTRGALYSWFGTSLTERSQPVADNILAIIVQPVVPSIVHGSTEFELAPDYLYDTRLFQWGGGGEVSEATKHQLPPELRLTLIALDEASWQRLPEQDVQGMGAKLMQEMNAGLFTVSANLSKDLKRIGDVLDREKIGHRIFTTAVPMRSARWASQ